MNWDDCHCPSWTGGVAVPKRKYREATTVGTDGVVVQMFRSSLNNHPVRFAATPPVQEGQWPQLAHVRN
jgi:hypothetical protein